ncbi:DUF2007 domain-containing protein [Bacteroides sp.]|uniref:putative signal transducing protein n=1 Tax=Bacteroides sp. TaxID=29523 RepID=UPI00261FC70C|nr:DUF2007 domain-containing protein [Bacteroides sp.]MDD3039239.1 DUF2007 domain-containing protein [Bacteroides sp.]
MRTVKLITCNDAMTAHILQGALENEGIESVLHNENFSFLYRCFVNNIAGVDIFVMEDEYERAVQILKENQSWPEDLKYCPYCGSEDIKFVLRKSKRGQAIGTAIICACAFVPPGNSYWEYICKQCHRAFEIPASKILSTEEEKEE